jgi:hypothetical protein
MLWMIHFHELLFKGLEFLFELARCLQDVLPLFLARVDWSPFECIH